MSKLLKASLRKTVAGIVAFATILSLSGVIALAPVSVAQAAVTIADGDLIKSNAVNSDGTPTYASLDVYIVKLVGTKKFKRLILNPTVFTSYGHLNAANIKTVDQLTMDSYKTSAMVRVDTDAAQKVFALVPNDDIGAKSWINVTTADFLAAGADPESIYTINAVDGGNYTAVMDITTSTQVNTFLTLGTLPSVVPVTGVVSVALAATTPAAGTIIGGQAIAPLASFTITNGNSTVATVNTLKLKKLGVAADTTLTKVYLYEGESRLSDDASVSSGVITWNNGSGLFTVPANSSRTIIVKSNIAVVSGQTVGVGIQAATDVTLASGTVTGTFPLNGNIMSIATATLASFDLATYTTFQPALNASLAPQEGFNAWRSVITVGTRAVYLRSMNFRVIGSIEAKDLTNFKLLVDGVQVGSTVASMNASGYVLFDLSAAPKKIEAGSPTFKVMVDVIGGSSRNFQVSLRQAADVSITDSDFGSNILARGTSTDSTAVYAEHVSGLQTVSVGTLTITKKSDSPSGNITLGATGVTLARYEMKALGENMKVENLRVYIDSSDANTQQRFQNGGLFVDNVLVGSTTDIYELNNATATYSEISLGSAVTVVPGTPKLLEIRADIKDNEGTVNSVSAGDTLTAVVAIGSSNVQRMVSASYVNVPSAIQAGNVLTVTTGTMALTKDQAYGSQSIVVPATAYKIGQWSLSGSSTEDINLDTIQVDLAQAGELVVADSLTNIYVVYGTKTSVLKATASIVAAANTWSISETLPKNTSMTFAFYGDLASTATDGGTNDTVIPSLLVSGSTASSAQAVYTGAGATGTALQGQTITAVSAGTLTVSLDNGTPQTAIAVAGSTPSDGSLKVKLTSTNEDMYVKGLTFYTDATADDAVIASATLWSATSSSGTYSQVGTAKTWDANGAVPGFVTWTLSGTDRIKVAKNGSVYLLVKPTYVASSEVTVTMQTPRLLLGDLQAEGSTTLVAAGTTLANTTGIIVQANSSATYVDSGDTVNDAAVATDDTAFTVSNNTAFSAGDVIFIDDAADGGVLYSGAELMVVLDDSGTVLTVKRGAFGTTAGVVTNANKIFRLSGNAATYTYAGVVGNAVIVAKDKLTLSVASDSPTGATTGGTQRVIFKFNAAAANNAEDVGENKVVLTSVDLTTTKSGLTVNNVALYPSDFDQNATYKTTCVALSQTKWRCTFDTDGATNEIIENGARIYVVRADVGSGTGTSNTLDVSIASLGSANTVGAVTAGDVVWTDGTTSISWVNQAGASYIQPASPMTLGASSGTTDATAPTISTVAGSFLFAEGATTTGDTLDLNDVITITFTERMDASLIKSTLIPGGAAVAIVDAATGDISMAGTGVVTVAGIATTDVDGGAADASTYTNTAALDSTGTILTLTITSIDSGTGALSAGEAFGDVTGLTTVMKDVSGNAMADSAVNASGAI